MSDSDRIKKRQDGEAFALSLRVVLAEFTLELDEILTPSGVTAVFGRSGSGKTTLLRAIAGFEKPVRGRIALGDQVWFDEEARFLSPRIDVRLECSFRTSDSFRTSTYAQI